MARGSAPRASQHGYRFGEERESMPQSPARAAESDASNSDTWRFLLLRETLAAKDGPALRRTEW